MIQINSIELILSTLFVVLAVVITIHCVFRDGYKKGIVAYKEAVDSENRRSLQKRKQELNRAHREMIDQALIDTQPNLKVVNGN